MKTENILKIELQDVNEVMSLIKEAIDEMESRNIYQWDEVYPDYNTIITDIQAETMFGIFKNLELAGIVVLDKNQSPEYSSIKWESNIGIPLVMHRLCVRPKFQGQGIAKQLLRFSEQFAIDNSYKSIILDSFSRNHVALNLYENNGYMKKGKVTFRKGDFHCYQKIM
nr:GNAT family N-acetyltransferase [Pedobacter panaciterrae]